MGEANPPPHHHDDAELWTAERVREVAEAIDAKDADALRALVAGLEARDIADLIELLPPDRRVALILLLGPAFDIETFSELDEAVRDQLSEALPNDYLATVAARLESDDAAYLIESLDDADRDEVLARLSVGDRAALERNLDYPEDTAGRLMQADFAAVAPFWTVGRVIDHMRESADLPETFSEIFVVDPAFKVLGSIDLSRLLRTKREVRVDEIMEKDRHLVLATDDQEEVARQFERYNLFSAPVVDENRRLVGVITVDDMVDVIQEEADEDMRALGGVGDESLADSVLDTARSRVPWLVVNFATAILASTVIRRFDASIEQMVALAVLMPLVASMGGNAAIQTMTVTVRALAMNKLGRVNAPRVVTREVFVSLINGLLLSLIGAAVVYVWFGSGQLGAVLGAAIVVNLLAAALAGILIPLALDYFDLDPAPSSTVFVTMVTDVVGFFAFLGLASAWLL